MPDDPNKLSIDVVLGNQVSSTVTNAVGYPQNVAVTLPGSAGTAGADGQDGAQGPQGEQGPDGSFTPDGPEGSVQFKALDGSSIDFSGISQFHFDKTSHFLTISGGGLSVNEGKVHITGSLSQSDRFLINDGDSSLLKVDTSSKKITFSEDSAVNEYYLGVGIENPTERLHVGNGNLRVDGEIKAGGHIIPVLSGIYDLGSESHPFRDIYVDGESIHFVNAHSKISSTAAGGVQFSQTVTGSSGQPETKNLLNIDTQGNMIISGIMSGDLPYSNITNGFLFVEKSIQIGEQYFPVDFGTTLSYNPSVVASVSAPELANEVYGVSVLQVTTTGFWASLTAPPQLANGFIPTLNESGYTLAAFISPKADDASIIRL